MKKQTHVDLARQGGFSLTEMLVAASLFLVGIVAVAQLVPTTIQLNMNNRNDSSAMTYAQREMAQMLQQPLDAVIIPPPGTEPFSIDIDPDHNPVYLGDPGQPGVVVGSPLLPVVNNIVAIDFSQATVPFYSTTLADANDPTGTKYDMRWAVVTTTQDGKVIAKRFIVGVVRLGGNGFGGPVTLDAVVQK